MLQVVVAMIPGEPVEILAGLLYGPLWGTLSCMLGILIGSLIVYFLVRRLACPDCLDLHGSGQVSEPVAAQG